jgi:hypothetical protein
MSSVASEEDSRIFECRQISSQVTGMLSSDFSFLLVKINKRLLVCVKSLTGKPRPKPKRPKRKKEPEEKKKSPAATKPRKSLRLELKSQCYVKSCSVCLLPILQDVSKDRNALRAENELLTRENARLREEVRVLKFKLRNKNKAK